MKIISRLAAASVIAVFASAAQAQSSYFEPLPTPAPLTLPEKGQDSPTPTLTALEQKSDLDLRAIAKDWYISTKKKFFYSCNKQSNLQVIMPGQSMFDYHTDDTPQTRLQIAHGADQAMQAVVDTIADDPTLYFTMRKQMESDTGPLSINAVRWLDAYGRGTQQSDGSRVYFPDTGLIAVAAGCGGIDSDSKFNHALKHWKTTLSPVFL